MKNRTVIGIICMVLAVVMTFAVSPLVSKLTDDTVSVPRLSADVQRGSVISEGDIEMVSVSGNSLPSGVITESKNIVGKYAASTLYAGDYVTNTKLTTDANTADSAFYGLNGKKFAMSFTIDNFASGLSGKLENGDIISLVVLNKDNGKASIPAAFKYVKVITATTAGGIDKDSIVKNDDGSFDIPTTVTVLVNETQAKLLAEYEEESVSCALVYRGELETANKFIETQDKYFETHKTNTTETEETVNG